MRGNNQRKFFILVISSPCLVSHGRALLCLQHSPSQFSSLEMEPHHCTLCTATATFPEPAWIFFLPLPLNNSFSKPGKDAAPLPQKSIAIRVSLCPASLRARCLEEESFPRTHQPLEALIFLPGLCAADIQVSSGNVISLARRLAGFSWSEGQAGKGTCKCSQ